MMEAVSVFAFTVNELLLLLERKFVSPAKLAATPLLGPGLYVPALMPDRLALFSVATPLEFVAALPTLDPLSVKLTVSPFTPELSDVLVRVAERLTVPP